MKFAVILREAGLNPVKFPKSSEISVTLYDEDDLIDDRDDITFTKNLFVNNIASYEGFFQFVERLEKQDIESMNIKIDQFFVVVFYKTPNAACFPRETPASCFN